MAKKHFKRRVSSGSRFATLPSVSIPRSKFDRSFSHSGTADSGYLFPVFWDLVYPGDTVKVDGQFFARLLSSQAVPVMDNIYWDFFPVFVPLRLVWDHWENFLGAQKNPDDSVDYLVPEITCPSAGWPVHSISDYLGVRVNTPNQVGFTSMNIDAFVHRAYNLTWNQWFRDENLQPSAVVDTGDGPDNPANYPLRKRGKRHDYFTSALPWPQKGPGVEIPLGTTAPVRLNSEATNNISISALDNSGKKHRLSFIEFNGSNPVTSSVNSYQGSGSGSTIGVAADPDKAFVYNGGLYGKINKNTQLYTDLTDATAATINTLRTAFAIQRLYERDARGGTRINEILLSHFSVRTADSRLQLPELLGFWSVPVVTNPVVQTSGSSSDNHLGELGAYSVANSGRRGFTKSFTEHGILMILSEFRTPLSYQQGIPRELKLRTKTDFYWPSFAYLGEDGIFNYEIFAQGNAKDLDLFGYQERFAYMRYKPDMITGYLRSDVDQSLDVYTYAQDFANLPTLSSQFIEDNPPLKRAANIQRSPEFIFNINFDYIEVRPMPTWSVPGLIDHH